MNVAVTLACAAELHLFDKWTNAELKELDELSKALYASGAMPKEKVCVARAVAVFAVAAATALCAHVSVCVCVCGGGGGSCVLGDPRGARSLQLPEIVLPWAVLLHAHLTRAKSGRALSRGLERRIAFVASKLERFVNVMVEVAKEKQARPKVNEEGKYILNVHNQPIMQLTAHRQVIFSILEFQQAVRCCTRASAAAVARAV
jgi:hypothetical protein